MQKMHSYNLIHHTNHCLVLPKYKQIHFNQKVIIHLVVAPHSKKSMNYQIIYLIINN